MGGGVSEIVWTSDDGELTVSRYCGPAGPPDRRRWQFTTPSDVALATLSRTELEDLLSALLVDTKVRPA